MTYKAISFRAWGSVLLTLVILSGVPAAENGSALSEIGRLVNDLPLSADASKAAATPSGSPGLLPIGEGMIPIEELDSVSPVPGQRTAGTPDDQRQKLQIDLNDNSEMSRELTLLRGNVRKCLAIYRQKHENAATRSPWGIMHAMITFGAETEIYASGHKKNAIGWLCWNNACRGMRLLRLENGRIQGNEGPGLQGHAGQFLALLAQCGVKSSSPIRVSGRDFTVADLIASEMASCKPKTELTFKLIGLSHYLKSDTAWRTSDGERWDIPRLIKEELAQPIVGAACGGTHRMMGFSYSVRVREKRGEPVTGEWLRAQKYVKDYVEYTFRLQNPDGSFSTKFYEGRGNSSDIQERLRTTGHLLEWLVFTMPEDRLLDPRLLAAVKYLSQLMLRNQDEKWEVGPKGHAVRALVLFDKRVSGRSTWPQARRRGLLASGDDERNRKSLVSVAWAVVID